MMFLLRSLKTCYSKAAKITDYRFFKKFYFTLIVHASTNKFTHQNTTHHQYSIRTRFDTKVPLSGSVLEQTYKEYSKIIINTDSNVLRLYSFP